MFRRLIVACLLALYVASAGATIHVRDGSTWREIQEVHVKDGSTWRRIQEIYVKDGSTWRLVYAGDVISISNQTVQSVVQSPSDALATYSLTSVGTITTQVAGGGPVTHGNWVTPTSSASGYEVVCTVSSGSLANGTCNGTALDLASSQSWSVSRTVNTAGTNTAVISLSIRRKSDQTVMDSATITLQATVEV